MTKKKVLNTHRLFEGTGRREDQESRGEYTNHFVAPPPLEENKEKDNKNG